MIVIQDRCLKDILNNYYEDKNFYTQEELDGVINITIDSDNLNDSLLDDISRFKNINSIIFMDVLVNNRMLMNVCKLNNLKTLEFYNCIVDDIEVLKESKINTLVLNNCKFDDYIYINNIDSLINLYLDNCENIDLKKLSIIKKLKELSIWNVEVHNCEYLIYLDEIEKIRIDGSSIKDISPFLVMENLKVLVIDEQQALLNKKIVLELLEKNVSVVNSNNQSVVMYYG